MHLMHFFLERTLALAATPYTQFKLAVSSFPNARTWSGTTTTHLTLFFWPIKFAILEFQFLVTILYSTTLDSSDDVPGCLSVTKQYSEIQSALTLAGKQVQFAKAPPRPNPLFPRFPQLFLFCFFLPLFFYRVIAIGGTLTWFSFTSTTADPKVLRKKEFLNATVNIDPVTKAVSSVKNLGIYGAAAQPSGKTIFQIHTINGVNISPFSAEEDEDEIILPAGSTFRITGINDWHDGITEVRLREIDDDDGGKDDFQQDPLYMNINQYMAVDPPNAAVTNVYDVVDSPPSYTSLGAHDSSA